MHSAGPRTQRNLDGDGSAEAATDRVRFAPRADRPSTRTGVHLAWDGDMVFDSEEEAEAGMRKGPAAQQSRGGTQSRAECSDNSEDDSQ